MTSHNTTTCFLSVIIAGRNEENNIARCIESILKANEDIEDTEIIFVDSASTDKTIEIAMAYPIKILQLRQSWRLSASAGYYIGFIHSRGKYIQFQCGDTILDENWFKNAIPILEKDNSIAGISGIISQENYNTKRSKDYSEWLRDLPIGEVEWLAGDTLFKRDALLDVGVFNPYLMASEEGDLSYRMSNAGYKLLRLAYPMSHHLGATEQGLCLLRKTLRYEMAHGQILGYSLMNKRILWQRVKEYRPMLASQLFLALFFSALAVFFTLNQVVLLYVFIIYALLLLGLILYEKRNIKDAIKVIVYNIGTSPHFIWGFLSSKRNPRTYPTNVEIIKDDM